MNTRAFVAIILFAPLIAVAAEEAHPDSVANPYTALISQVQEALRARGFDAGPVNGDFGEKTQAALAQFQLSVPIPAGGQLDEETLRALGVAREQAAAGGT